MILYGRIPDVVGKYKGRNLLICGSGRCLWDDLWQLMPPRSVVSVINDRFDVMAINHTGLHLPLKLDHWFSGYYMFLKYWRALRCHGDYGEIYKDSEHFLTHSRFADDDVDVVWKAEKYGFGTSSLDACSIGILMGYDKILLAGVPFDNSMHFYDAPWITGGGLQDFSNVPEYAEAWEKENREFFQGRVKSLSGWTKQLLGGWNGEENRGAESEITHSQEQFPGQDHATHACGNDQNEGQASYQD